MTGSVQRRASRGGKVRVLMYSTYFPPEYSGAAKQALSLARELQGRGHHAEFVTVRWNGLPAREQVEGFRVDRVKQGQASRHREVRLWWNLSRYALRRRRDFDVIHSHGAYYLNSFVGPLARFLGWRSLVKASLAQDDLSDVGRTLSGRVHGWMLRKVDACVGISRELVDEFRTCCPAHDRVVYIPNGVDTVRFRLAAADGEKGTLRRRLGLPEGRPLALTVGVFDRRKNIGWLMEEWARSKAFGTNAVLVAIGPQAREDLEGKFLRGLDELADQYPELLLRREPVVDVEDYYRAADLFILPSTSEGLPNVVLEAMASGLPCVASAVSGTRELVVDGVTGRTFTPGSAEELGAAVRGVLGPLGEAMGARARRRIEAEFSIQAVADQYEQLYTRLLRRTVPQVSGKESGRMHA